MLGIKVKCVNELEGVVSINLGVRFIFGDVFCKISLMLMAVFYLILIKIE